MRFVICDVFTDRPLAGNQLAVFTDAQGIPEHLLQPLAREINFSETVFVYPPAAPGTTARIRIFVPTDEIRFAGHPVLGTAFVLGAESGLDEVVLETPAAIVPVVLDADGGRMRQPVPVVREFPDTAELLAALGVEHSMLPVLEYDNGMPHVYVMAESTAAVAALEPDIAALVRLARTRGHVQAGLNCFAGSGDRWATRMFAPAQGVAEDPATGSAAGPLACHLVRHGLVEPGTEITISQGVEIGRPSTLYARAEGTAEQITGVEVAGGVAIVGEGVFRVP